MPSTNAAERLTTLVGALYPESTWGEEGTSTFMSRLLRIDISEEQAEAAIREYRTSETRHTRTPNMASLLNRLRACLAERKDPGASDVRTWPKWKVYQLHMEKLDENDRLPEQPLAVYAEWWNRQGQNRQRMYGGDAQDHHDHSVCGMAFDLVREGVCHDPEEALALATRETGLIPSAEATAWVLKMAGSSK